MSSGNRNLLILALTHSSYANEKKLGKAGCNERLEFLGDAVLELISSDFLYKKFTQIPEGELTKKRASLVCEPSLAYCARDFGLPQYLLLGKGEDMTGGRNRDSIVSDATEALLGAIYLDGGFASAKEFVLKFILNDLENKQLFYDSKTILQEIVQEKGTHLVEYHLIKEEGPDHNKKFYRGCACQRSCDGYRSRTYQESCRTGSCLPGNPEDEKIITRIRIHVFKKY